MANQPLPFDLEDAAVPPAPSANPRQDVEETMRLLTWARDNGWDIPELRVGSVELRVRDVKPRYKAADAPAQPEAAPLSIWDQFAPPRGHEDEAG